MKILTINRGNSTDEGTFSQGTLDDLKFDFVELPWRDNLPNKSCVPAGTYTATTVMSAHFGFPVYLLNNVPGRYGCEIHPANFGGNTDAGLYTDLLGCLGPGYGTGRIGTPAGTVQMGVLNSVRAFHDLMNATGGAPIQVVINPAPLSSDGQMAA